MMGCMADVFSYYGFVVDESIIFSLSSGIYFYYKNFNNSKNKSESTQIIMSSMQYDIVKIFDNISKTLNLQATICCSIKGAEIKEFIDYNIGKNQPIISILSRKPLEYMEKRSRDNAPHVANIIGCDFPENNIYISDTYVPSVPITTYSGLLSWDNYNEALLSVKDMFDKEYTFKSIVYLPLKINPLDVLSLKNKIKPLNEMAKEYYQTKYIYEDFMYGRFALKHFIDDVENWLSMEITPALLNIFRSMSVQISNYGGQYITNQLMAEYMGYLFKTYGNTIYQRLKDEFSSLSKKWFIISNLLMKASFGKMDDVRDNICNRLKDIFELEDIIFQALLEIWQINVREENEN
jgi:hypothetical protein